MSCQQRVVKETNSTTINTLGVNTPARANALSHNDEEGEEKIPSSASLIKSAPKVNRFKAPPPPPPITLWDEKGPLTKRHLEEDWNECVFFLVGGG